jgi:hypothetical protein
MASSSDKGILIMVLIQLSIEEIIDLRAVVNQKKTHIVKYYLQTAKN